jgi:hypothetical protein
VLALATQGQASNPAADPIAATAPKKGPIATAVAKARAAALDVDSHSDLDVTDSD